MTGEAIWVVPGGPYETRVDGADEQPSAATGVLRVRLSTRYLRRAERPPRLPVLAIDDVPVSAGFGTVTVRLPPGRYLVGVQNRWDEGTVPVTIRNGHTTDLDYLPLGKTAERGLFGTPEDVDAERRRRTRVSITVLVTLYAVATILCAVPFALGVGSDCGRGVCTAGSDPWRGPALWIALGGIVAAFAALLVWHVRPRRRPYFQPELDKRSPAARPPEPIDADGFPPGSVALLDARSADLPELAAGWGAVRFVAHLSRQRAVVGEGPDDDPSAADVWTGSPMLRSEQRRPVGRGTGDGRRAIRRGLDDVWTAAPTVRIDGRTVPAGWGNWWYALPAGRHRIEVGPPGRRSSDDAEPGTQDATISIVAGRVFHIGCLASVRYRFDPRLDRLVDDRPTMTLHVNGNEK